MRNYNQLVNSNDDDEKRYNVPALERGLRLLAQFSRQEKRLGAPELARRLDLPRSTVFRLLNTLEAAGFVERVDEGHSYQLGLGVLRLGFEYLASLELTQLGAPILQQFTEETGYASNLVVLDGRSIVYVAKVAPSSPFRSSVSVGTRLPAHATVLGRVLLRDMSLADLAALYPEEQLQRFSSRTPATVSDLYRQIQLDRQQEYVLAEAYFESHISTIAAPVRDISARVVAAIGTTVPSDQIRMQDKQGLIDKVCAAASQLSHLLNYAPTRQ
jgi:DNA-binding IclR family transcriptional regulator